jgi:hypothetical protein
MHRYKWQEKFENGEFISKWNGYGPFYAGCFNAYPICLGGEEKYNHCYGFFSHIGDIDWWDKTELDKLSKTQQEELLFILRRNKKFNDYKNKIVNPLAEALNVEPYQIHRLNNKELKDFLQLVHSKSNKPNEKPEWE